MKPIQRKINVNVSQPNNLQYINVMQGTANYVEIVATVYDGNRLYTIDADAVWVKGKLASGTPIYQLADSFDEHTITVKLSANSMAADGDIEFTFRFISNGQAGETFPAVIHVTTSPLATIKQTAEVTDLMSQMDAVASGANDAKQAADNAKYYANIAKTSSETADADKDIVVAKAQQVADNTASVTSAKESIDESLASVTTKAQQVSDNTTIVTQAKDDIEGYVESVHTDATTVSTSASNAKTSEDNAKQSEVLAKQYKDECQAIAGGDYVPSSAKGIANGVATLDSNGKVPTDQLPSDINVDIATASKVGTVKPDGNTITIDEDGTLHGSTQTTVDNTLSKTSHNAIENQAVANAIGDMNDALNNKISIVKVDELPTEDILSYPTLYALMDSESEDKIFVLYEYFDGDWIIYGGKGGSSVGVNELTLVQKPTKTKYEVGDTVDLSGLKLHVVYSSMVEKDITPDDAEITVTPTTISINDTKITCSYTYGTTKSVEIPITVKYLTKIEVTTQPQTKYNVGKTFNPNGMVVKATYSTGETANVEGYTYSPTSALSTSDTKVTVTYEEKGITKTCDIPISVVESTTYGFHINSNESDSSACVTYLEDAVGMTPAKMNYSSGNFDYGSWKNAFFIPKPCMLKYDGTVDYYLNENDYTKKTNGATSDITSDGYGGNAMMEWGQNGSKIWYKIVPDSNTTSYSVYISDTQVDSGYKAWSFINNAGDTVDHFYTPIFNGYKDSNGKMRSLSGKTPTVSLTRQQEVTACQANNPSGKNMWYTEVFCDMTLINFLLVLMAKSIDTQTAYGKGVSSASAAISTGTMNTKGLFWGSTDGTSGVKIFGMENYWGNLFRAIAGYMNVSYTQKYKMTYGTQDGSGASSYNFDGSGYKTGVTYSASSGYISKQTANTDGIFPSEASGSSSTYYADYVYNSSGTYYALRGGNWRSDAYCGAFCWNLYFSASDTRSAVAAAVSCKPLV